MNKSSVEIKEAEYPDLNGLKALYFDLHEKVLSASDFKLRTAWDDILTDERVHPFILFADNIPASSCTLSIIPNLTWDARPYAVIENVVTKKEFRKRGFAGEVIKYALNFAWEKNCYKTMVITGRQEEYVTHLYENAGFKKEGKTGMTAYNPDFHP